MCRDGGATTWAGDELYLPQPARHLPNLVGELSEGGASVEAEHLEEFLREKLRLSPDSVEELLAEVTLKGHVIIPDTELSETDMAAAGMQHLSPGA
jgi:hypothetical protein